MLTVLIEEAFPAFEGTGLNLRQETIETGPAGPEIDPALHLQIPCKLTLGQLVSLGSHFSGSCAVWHVPGADVEETPQQHF